jgi:hypothetical protein
LILYATIRPSIEYAAEPAGVGAAMIGGIGSDVFKGYEEARSLAPVFDVISGSRLQIERSGMKSPTAVSLTRRWHHER